MRNFWLRGQDMRLEWIDDILAVLDTGSLARAAEKRLLTQSAFTRRVRMIEDSIGAPLFDRRRKPIRLLAGVEALAPELRDLSLRMRKTRDKLKSAATRTGGTLSFACQHAITTSVSPWIVRALATGSDQSVRVRSSNREECLVQLLSGEVDFALMYTLPDEVSPFLNHAFLAMTLGQDVLIPVCAPSLADVAREGHIPAVSYPPEVFLGQVFVSNIAPRLRDDVTIVSKAETALTLAVYEYAMGGIGVAWLPRSMVVDALARGALVSLEPDLPAQAFDIKAFRRSDGSHGGPDPAWPAALGEIALPEHLRPRSETQPGGLVRP